MPDSKSSYKVILSLGSNLDNGAEKVASALTWLTSLLSDLHSTDIYVTAPISGNGHDYSNAVVGGYTEYDMETLNTILKHYEVSAGRTEDARSKGEVPIDIDIVVYNDVIVRPRDYNTPYFRHGIACLTSAEI